MSLKNLKEFFINFRPRYVIKSARSEEGLDGRLVVRADQHSYISEQYKSLCGKLVGWSPLRESKVLLLTSSQPGEGKSTTAGNLALGISGAFGARTLLIDGDLRRPHIHSMFNIPRSPGLTDLIEGRADLEDLTAKPYLKNLHILPAGSRSKTQSTLLSSPALSDMMNDLRSRFDRIIFDAPPVLKVADVSMLGEFCDAVLFIVKAEATPARLVKEALRLLEGTSALPCACILSNMRCSPDYYSYFTNRHYRKHYGNRYSYYGTEVNVDELRPSG